MKDSLYDLLLRRECGGQSLQTSARAIYGCKQMIDDLDIVNELGGHTGCVNALSWSRSGNLLASGSDDQYLNIYSYQSDSSNSPFQLKTNVHTGHRANIFSVKFMPHSNDRTLITCGGDSEVRIFDIEYSSSNEAAAPSTSTRSERFNKFFEGVQHLGEENTNARVFRSHSDRVKRIVTESSPYLFLTCSEDGEVRQWDLRQPSSAYPAPRGGQGFMAHRQSMRHDTSNVPPALISYKRFNLDLNTISCSPSQPHYIALGGAHMHCFLHDRRMAGRDIFAERGSPDSSTPSLGSSADDIMSQATRCVRRFAPRNSDLRDIGDGHITACKISDANPNEMVVSWSGDHIYSFNLIKSPDAREPSAKPESKGKGRHSESPSRDSREQKQKHKRKRESQTSSSSHGGNDHHLSRRLEIETENSWESYESSNNPSLVSSNIASDLYDMPSLYELGIENSFYQSSMGTPNLNILIADNLMKIKNNLFVCQFSHSTEQIQTHDAPDLNPFASAVTSARVCLIQMTHSMCQSLPYDSNFEISQYQLLNRRRNELWRFVHAAGTVALRLASPPNELTNEEKLMFSRILPPLSHGPSGNQLDTHFGYDFIKAILLWTRGGRQGLLAGFQCDSGQAVFQIPADAPEDAIDTMLIPYLLDLAGTAPIMDIGDRPNVFDSQRDAVMAFGNAAKEPLVATDTQMSRNNPAERSTTQFWVMSVCRGLLMTTAVGIDRLYVEEVFEEFDESSSGSESTSEVDFSHGWEPGTAFSEVPGNRDHATLAIESSSSSEPSESSSDDSIAERFTRFQPGDSSDDGDPQFAYTNFSGPSFSERLGIASDAPCMPHSQVYSGHCNVKTVKDVNFFGLNDEYVVSGSDSGHVFIWDRKTAKLVNILSGDSDTVNVIEGHPNEPMLAVSGIDNTIKIFSPDRRAQDHARRGQDVLDPDCSANIFNATGERFGLHSRKCLHDSYRIMTQNDMDRQGGLDEAHVTRNMLSHLSSAIERRRTGGEAPQIGFQLGAGGPTITLNDECLMM